VESKPIKTIIPPDPRSTKRISAFCIIPNIKKKETFSLDKAYVLEKAKIG